MSPAEVLMKTCGCFRFLNKGVIVGIIGSDGAGKTTLALRLLDEMKRSRVTAIVYGGWGGANLPISMILGKLFSKFSRNSYQAQTGTIGGESHINSIKRIVEFAILLDYIVSLSLKILIFIFLGYNVILDKYFQDVVVNLHIAFRKSLAATVKLLLILERLMPKPDLLLLINVSPQIAFARKKDIANILYCETQAALYKIISELFEVHCLNGEEPPETLAKKAIELVSALHRSWKETDTHGARAYDL